MKSPKGCLLDERLFKAVIIVISIFTVVSSCKDSTNQSPHRTEKQRTSMINVKIRVLPGAPDGLAGRVYLDYQVKYDIPNFFTENPSLKVFEKDKNNTTDVEVSDRYYSHFTFPISPGSLTVRSKAQINASDSVAKKTFTDFLIDSLTKAPDRQNADSICLGSYLSILNFIDTKDTVVYSIDITPLYWLLQKNHSLSGKDATLIEKYKFIISAPVYRVGKPDGNIDFCSPKFNIERNFQNYEYVPHERLRYDTIIVPLDMIEKR
jgi:hypothetical protein